MSREWEETVRRGDAGAVRQLIAAGQDVNALDRYGQTALMIAAHEGHSAVVSVLLEHGADLNHTAKHGLSAVMLAVIRGDAASVEALVRAGADLSIRGTGAPGFYGKTARELAAAQRRDDLVAILTPHA